MKQVINYLLENEVIDKASVYTASKLASLLLQDNETIELACLLVLYSLQQGQSCFELTWLNTPFWQKAPYDWEAFLCNLQTEELAFLQETQDETQQKITPLVITKERIYVYRYYLYETYIAKKIKQLGQGESFLTEPIKDKLILFLADLFPNAKQEKNEQCIACLVSLTKSFVLLSGAPGTGKTTTAKKLIQTLQYMQTLQDREAFRVCLTAPTGKAAAKLNESFTTKDEQEPICFESAKTIHRLLEPKQGVFSYNEERLLPYDIFVIDEVSMIDIELMFHLLKAIPLTARVILLGDKNQLSSVSTGDLLRELYANVQATSLSKKQVATLTAYFDHNFILPLATDVKEKTTFQESIVVLDKNYRFPANQDIGMVIKAIQEEDIPTLSNILDNGKDVIVKPEIEMPYLQTWIQETWQNYFQATTPSQLLQERNKGQVLCLTREAVSMYNQKITFLQQTNLGREKQGAQARQSYIVDRNLYAFSLFNGDSGVIYANQDGNNRIWFTMNDGTIQDYPLHILTNCSISFAMTVHKAQGSEFDSILLILPSYNTPLMTKEIIYTAISRAKKRVVLCGNKADIIEAIKTKSLYTQGLQKRIWQS